MSKRKVATWALVAILIVAQQLLFLSDIGIVAISAELLSVCKSVDFAGTIVGLINLGLQHSQQQ